MKYKNNIADISVQNFIIDKFCLFDDLFCFSKAILKFNKKINEQMFLFWEYPIVNMICGNFLDFRFHGKPYSDNRICLGDPVLSIDKALTHC